METLLLIKPRLTEKAFGLSTTVRTYVFEVPKGANKLSIKRAVEKQFTVTVTNVNTLHGQDKAKQVYRKRGGMIKGVRSGVKRAYVTLKEGDSIPVFAVEEEKK